MRCWTPLVLAACMAQATLAADTKARVSLELATQAGLSPGAAQQWYKTLSGLGIGGLQIRGSTGGEEPSVTQQGPAGSPSYKVVGILATDNLLYLPGGKFSANDTARLRKWLDTVSQQGAEGVTATRSPFGLAPKQWEEINDDLKRPVSFSTRGMTFKRAVSDITARLKHPLAEGAAGEQALASDKINDELRGLSSGTALAALLRPVGLALRPERGPGGELRYRIDKSSSREAWPVGWKPKAKAKQVLGDLFEFLNVEIKDVPVSEAVKALEGRLKVPLLFDHNAMALHAIDPSQVQADVPNKRMTYSQILNRVLMQARLKYELRVDEADKPFLWITTVKPAE
ncbi:MAG TPA: hypothetical protein VHV08_01500 [Pirellulales bacterium]|nr:hypothetical protein [Pirellulales bacterium]